MNVAVDIPPFLDRAPVIWSYTLLSNYRNCPAQTDARYISKTIKYVETDEMRFGTKVHKAFEHRLTRQQPLPPEFNMWEPFAKAFEGQPVICEMNMGITRQGTPCDSYDKKAVYGRGKGDAVIVNGENAYIGDWKTGKPREDPFELEIVAVLLKARYPQITNIKGQYFWLKEHRAGAMHDLSDVNATWAEVNRLYSLLMHDRATGQWAKKKSGLCGWCPLIQCEHHP